MQRKAVYLQVPAAWQIRDSHLKAHLPLSAETEVFIRREREQNEEITGGGCQVLYVQTSTVRSDEASDGPVCSLLV